MVSVVSRWATSDSISRRDQRSQEGAGQTTGDPQGALWGGQGLRAVPKAIWRTWGRSLPRVRTPLPTVLPGGTGGGSAATATCRPRRPVRRPVPAAAGPGACLCTTLQNTPGSKLPPKGCCSQQKSREEGRVGGGWEGDARTRPVATGDSASPTAPRSESRISRGAGPAQPPRPRQAWGTQGWWSGLWGLLLRVRSRFRALGSLVSTAFPRLPCCQLSPGRGSLQLLP